MILRVRRNFFEITTFPNSAHLGAVEEHGRRILELVISDEIANLELEIALQMYRERVDRLDERLHEFRQSQELPYARAAGHGLMDAFYFVESFRRG